MTCLNNSGAQGSRCREEMRNMALCAYGGVVFWWQVDGLDGRHS